MRTKNHKYIDFICLRNVPHFCRILMSCKTAAWLSMNFTWALRICQSWTLNFSAYRVRRDKPKGALPGLIGDYALEDKLRKLSELKYRTDFIMMHGLSSWREWIQNRRSGSFSNDWFQIFRLQYSLTLFGQFRSRMNSIFLNFLSNFFSNFKCWIHCFIMNSKKL